jgi:hypothetical protein
MAMTSKKSTGKTKSFFTNSNMEDWNNCFKWQWPSS